MRKIFVFVLGIFLITFLSSFFGNSISEKRKMVINITGKLGKKFKKNYNLNFMGISEAAEDGKYKNLGLELNYKGILSKGEGRILLIKCVQETLNAFNSCPQFKQYMSEFPFTGNNLVIHIYAQPTNISDVYYPDIAVFGFYNNALHYKTNSPENKYIFFSKEEETLEEALRIVESQK